MKKRITYIKMDLVVYHFFKKKSTLPLAKVCGTAQGPQITSARDYEKNCLVLFPKYSKAEISATLNFFLF
jgi:hypothetical protein